MPLMGRMKYSISVRSGWLINRDSSPSEYIDASPATSITTITASRRPLGNARSQSGTG
jgi:hypothetical protein